MSATAGPWREAENGRDGLDRLASVRPGIVLLDLTMPVMDGFAFLEVMRAVPDFADVPVLVLTALDLTMGNRRRLHGVSQILNKGDISMAALAERLRQPGAEPADRGGKKQLAHHRNSARLRRRGERPPQVADRGRMVSRRSLFSTLAAFALTIGVDIGQGSVRSAEAVQPQQLPTTFFENAAESWRLGEREDATFWLYVAQLRFRARLAARPDLTPSGEPALYASLMEVVGRPINEYALGDIQEASRQIDRALAWDAANPDLTISEDVRRSTREGLVSLREQILREADAIRRKRARNGLLNR